MNDLLAIIRSTSLGSELEREIEAMILRDELRAGDRISEGELAARFGVSRSPVREALRALDAVGLVDVVPNRGAFVRRVDIAEAMEVYEVRAALFAEAGRLMAVRGSEAATAALSAMHERMTPLAAAHNVEAYAPLNFAFHEAIVDGAGNTTLADGYRMLVKRLRLFRAKNLMFGDTLAQSHREHGAIVAAVAARDGAAAWAACHAHVEAGRARVMARIETERRAETAPPEKRPAETTRRGRTRRAAMGGPP